MFRLGRCKAGFDFPPDLPFSGGVFWAILGLDLFLLGFSLSLDLLSNRPSLVSSEKWSVGGNLLVYFPSTPFSHLDVRRECKLVQPSLVAYKFSYKEFL